MFDATVTKQAARSMLMRYAMGVGLGTMATFFLFMLMHKVIANPNVAEPAKPKGEVVDFVRLIEDKEVKIDDPDLIKPPPPDLPPPTRPPEKFIFDDDGDYVDFDDEVPPDFEPTGGYHIDGELGPIVKVAPEYPRRAEARGIEGYVIVEFVVTVTGSVRDPVVVEARPPGVFDRAAINAALKFKYRPRVLGGVPIEVSGVRNRIVFNLGGD